MIKDWTNFWQSYRILDIKNDQDLLYQAGKTLGGKVIDQDQFNLIIAEIVKKLDLKKEDRLLDLCCGNGVLTYALSPKVTSIIGIDFSVTLIQNARDHKNAENIHYYHKDIKELEQVDPDLSLADINKILIYDALAYFCKSELIQLLKTISGICDGSARILIAAVLDRKKRWAFFNTPSRIFQYIINMKLLGNTMGIGKWWTRNELIRVGSTVGMSVEILDQDPSIFTSHYRLDVLFKRNRST